MIVRLLSWAVFLSLIYGVWTYVHNWRSPMAVNPVLSSLPPMSDDCHKKDCLHQGGAK